MSIVSIGESEILTYMKWERILELSEVSQFTPIPSPIASSVNTTPPGAMLIGTLLLGT